MAEYDTQLLEAARILGRRRGRGKLPAARTRRSISTTYYALFHFLLEEVGKRAVGTNSALRVRRRILARSVTHKGARTALDKVKGPEIGLPFQDFFGGAVASTAPPQFMCSFARAFADAQTKRLDADYDLNKPLSEGDARVLWRRARRVIRGWRAATSRADRDFKHALCLLVLLNGRLRTDEP